MVCLAVIVSFTVYIGLIEPAESASGQLACGMEEHEHTQDCFELICGFDDESEEEISVDTTEIGSEETTETACETEETTTETTETTTSTEVEETAPVHVHSDKCYRLICLTEAHLHKQDCYNQPVETTEPAATETSASTSTGTGTTTSTEQTTESTTTTTELSEEVYELNAALFGELYMDRVSVLADAKTITKDGKPYTYYEIEDVKFYYDNATLYVNNECFSYSIDGGTVGDNAHHPACNVTSNISVEYNGTTRKGVYNFDYPRLGDVRYISFEAPEDGTLVYVFSLINDGEEFKMQVTTNSGVVADKDFKKTTSNELIITVKKGEIYTIKQPSGNVTARIGYIDFIPNIKIEEYKFYYDNNKILNHHDCFSYPDGITGPNVNNITDKRKKFYNGIEYDYAYNFNGVFNDNNNNRYIELAAPANGTWILVFDDITEGNFDITVSSTYGNVTKSFTPSSDGVMTMSVQKDTVYTAKQTAIDGNQKGKARLVYAEFVPVPEAGKVYRIIDVKTGKYVELSGDNIELGGETPSGDLSNDFKLTDAGDGSFNIYPQSIENKIIDYDVNNKNIHIYNSNGNNNQKFQFILNDDGTYKIKSPGYNDSYWKVDGNNDIKTASSAEASNFRIVEATEIVYPKADIDTTKTYLIKNVRSRQYIHMEAEVPVYQKDDKGNIIYDENDNPIQIATLYDQIIQQKDVGADSQFKFISTGTAGEYYIVSTDEKLALTTDQNITNGTDVKYSEFNDAKNQKFYAEQMENDSVRFYQIDNNGKKFYLGINGESTNSGAIVNLWDADEVNDHQCFFLVPVIEPVEVPEANTRVEARVIFADYNDGKVDENTRNLYDEPAWIPTFSLYKNENLEENKDGNLVVDVSEARKDWCYQYNYVWDLGESNTNDYYYVALNGVDSENKITLNGKTFRVHYLKDTELGHPGQCNKNDPYSQSPSDYNQTGDQIIYIFLDPVVEEWWPNGNQPGTFDLSMKKRWDGHNSDGFDNRKKEKIQIQLQRLNSSGQWVEYKPEAFGETYTFKCYFEVVDVNGKNKRYVDLRKFLNYKKSLNIPDDTNVTNIKRTLTNNGAEYTIVYNNETYTFSEDDFNYEDLKNHNCLFEKESGTLKRANLELGYNEWNNVVLTVDGNNNPTHFTNGYYFNWKAIPYGQYRVIETQSFYDANENDVFDKGDRDTSNEYYYMSYPPMRDSRGVLHIQNFTKDMVLDIQKEWYDNTGTEKMDNPGKTVKVNIYRSLEKLSDPSVEKLGAPIYSYEEVTSDNIILKTTDGYDKLLLKTTSEQKYYYYIQEVSVDGYLLLNGNDEGFVKSTNGNYYVDYEDGDGRKFILKNKADFSLNIEKKWYQGDVELSYSKIENPIRPEFEIYKAHAKGTPAINTSNSTSSCVVKYTVTTVTSVNSGGNIVTGAVETRNVEDSLELIANVSVNNQGKMQIIYNNTTTTTTDSMFKTSELDLYDIVGEVTPKTGFPETSKVIRNDSNKSASVNEDYITLTNNNVIWIGTDDEQRNIKGKLIVEIYNFKDSEYNESAYMKLNDRKFERGKNTVQKTIKDSGGTIVFEDVNYDNNYQLTSSVQLNISKITFTLDNYYYIREKNSDSYTLLNGNDNGFVMNENGTYYTQITASNKNPTITAKNTADVEIDITKEWYADESMNISLGDSFDKSMKFKIYKAFAQGTPVADSSGYKVTVGDMDYQLTELSGEYITDEDGNRNIPDLPAFEEKDGTYHKLYYYVREIEGNYTTSNAINGFIPYESGQYGTAFDDTSSNSGKYNFVNTPKLDLTVNKIWKDANGEPYNAMVSTEIKFKVYRKIENGEFMPVPENGTDYVTSGLKKVIEGLDAYDENGNIYTYYIKEIDGETYFLSGFNVKYNDQTNPEECAFSWNKDGKQPVINVTNQAKPQNYELPETGGIGTHGYTVAGGIVVLLSAMILLFKRRTQL